MKSILAKQAPHRSPWFKMRARQEMQTGGSNRLASGARMERKDAVPTPAEDIGERSGASSASLMAMAPMIGRRPASLEARMRRCP